MNDSAKNTNDIPREYEQINIVPFNYAVSLIGGRWKMQILFWLWKNDVMRYSEIKKLLGGVTHKVLAEKLKELEADGLLLRTEYASIPPKVEYSLTDLGKTLMPVLQSICNWGHEHIPEEIAKHPENLKK